MLYQNCTILNDKFVIFVYQLNSIIFQGDELMTYCKYDTMGRKYGVAVSVLIEKFTCDDSGSSKFKVYSLSLRPQYCVFKNLHFQNAPFSFCQ